MATYKVIQDIEAEDHIIGPLTLRQFIFGLIAAFFGWLCFLAVSHGAAVFLVVLMPPALFFAFFAFPFGKDQPTEVWALAKLRFFLKPRRRIWDQSGMKELVTITAPKKIERVFTNGLSQDEVKSRLNALASTLDSRGWVVKNVAVNGFAQPGFAMAGGSDRLLDIGSLPQEVPNYSVSASEDILDAQSNPVAQQFDQMITQSEQAHRQQLLQQLNAPSPAPSVAAPSAGAAPSTSAQPADYWFMHDSGDPTALQATASSTSTASATAEEEAIVARARAQQASSGAANARMHTLRPQQAANEPAVVTAGAADNPADMGTTAAAPGPAIADPAILSLANNNDLNVATLAREAEKAKQAEAKEPPRDGEVVVSLR